MVAGKNQENIISYSCNRMKVLFIFVNVTLSLVSNCDNPSKFLAKISFVAVLNIFRPKYFLMRKNKSDEIFQSKFYVDDLVSGALRNQST